MIRNEVSSEILKTFHLNFKCGQSKSTTSKSVSEVFKQKPLSLVNYLIKKLVVLAKTGIIQDKCPFRIKKENFCEGLKKLEQKLYLKSEKILMKKKKEKEKLIATKSNQYVNTWHTKVNFHGPKPKGLWS